MKKRSAVERLARELRPLFADGTYAPELFERIARHVLARERRAKGRTVGWVVLRTECDESGEDSWLEIQGAMLDQPVPVRMTEAMGKRVGRVVLMTSPRSKEEGR